VFELRALHLLGRCYTTRTIPPDPSFLDLIVFWIRSCIFAQGEPQTSILLPMAFCIARIIGMNHTIGLLVETGPNFVPGLVLNYSPSDLYVPSS
jgi:hypothetical protein